jgi:hypothetical protein
MKRLTSISGASPRCRPRSNADVYQQSANMSYVASALHNNSHGARRPFWTPTPSYRSGRLTRWCDTRGIRYLRHLLHGNGHQELFHVSCRYRCGVRLPLLVLMRIGVVTDTADDETREVAHQASGFYLHAQNVHILFQLISNHWILNEKIY